MATATRPFKKRRASITIKEKYEMIVFMEQNPGMTHSKVAEQFSIPVLTLSGIASNAERIRKMYRENKVVSSCKRVRKLTLEVVNASLLQWFSNLHSAQLDFPISGEMLLKKLKNLLI